MPSFSAWIAAVDHLIQSEVGTTHEDIPDACWRDWFDDGLTPKEAWESYKEDNEEFYL